MEISTQIQINGTAEQVWEVLTDFKRYPQWNSFVRKLEGEVKVGQTIKVDLPGMSFTPKILVFKVAKEFRWKGKLWIKGLFDGEHIFELKSQKDGTTVFIHREKFQGILVPLFRKKLLIETKSGFEQMNSELKAQVEQQNNTQHVRRPICSQISGREISNAGAP